jgi:pseudouridine-5'-phosphate glycosidase
VGATGHLRGIRVASDVLEALRANAPVVALESALMTHGFAPPANLHIVYRMLDSVRAGGALPAVTAIVDGEPSIGLSDDSLRGLARCRSAQKISLRGLGLASSKEICGGTTVAASVFLAHRAGIRVFATGGIGGVHRGQVGDISADIPALAQTPVVVVCSGAKAILDLPATIELLETCGVPVLGYGTDEFPAFYSRRSGLGVDARVDTPQDVADVVHARDSLGLRAATLVCVPVPEADAVPSEEAEALVARAVGEAESRAIRGKDLTPFLLARVSELSAGQARRANEALLVSNAGVAAGIARALAAADRETG